MIKFSQCIIKFAIEDIKKNFGRKRRLFVWNKFLFENILIQKSARNSIMSTHANVEPSSIKSTFFVMLMC